MISAAAGFESLQSVTSLDLSNTGIGDRTMMALAKLPKLQRLYISDTAVTAGRCCRIQAATAVDCRVLGDPAEPRGAARGIDESARGLHRMTYERFQVQVPVPVGPASCCGCAGRRDSLSGRRGAGAGSVVRRPPSIRCSRKPAAVRAIPTKGWRRARGCISRPRRRAQKKSTRSVSRWRCSSIATIRRARCC